MTMGNEQMKDDEVYFVAFNAAINGLLSAKPFADALMKANFEDRSQILHKINNIAFFFAEEAFSEKLRIQELRSCLSEVE